MGKLRLDLWL